MVYFDTQGTLIFHKFIGIYLQCPGKYSPQWW